MNYPGDDGVLALGHQLNLTAAGALLDSLAAKCVLGT
jgi:hypothetical protein